MRSDLGGHIEGLLQRGAKVSLRAAEGEPVEAAAAWARRALASMAVTMVAAAAAFPAQSDAASLEARKPTGGVALPGSTAAFSAAEDARWKRMMPGQASLPVVRSEEGHPSILAKVADLSPVEVTIAGKKYQALNPLERIRLCKEVASEMKLAAYGMDWRNIYATVHAETAWAERTGMGLNGKPSFGLAQMELATAKSLGIDPNDKRSSLIGVAMLLKEASAWAKAKGHADKKAALSVYYNLSTKARNQWNGVTTDSLPQATQNHIRNLADGLAHATRLGPKYDKLLAAARSVERDESQKLGVAAALGRASATTVGVAVEAVATARMPVNLAVSHRGATADQHSGLASLKALRADMERFVGDLRQQARRRAEEAQMALEIVVDPGLLGKASSVIARHQLELPGVLERLAACVPPGYERVAMESQAEAGTVRDDTNMRMRNG